MYNREYTPDRITELRDNEIFVFGSNLQGLHGGGAARLAYERFGAVWGQGVGLQGRCYAIPTMQGGVETIKPYVDGFIEFASSHPELKFLVTRIGCGIAAFTPEEIAPLFEKALDHNNIILPKDFVEVIDVKKPSADQKKAILMWKMGLGNSNKRLNGEDFNPKKEVKATADSWKTEPMGEPAIEVDMSSRLTPKQMDIIRYGHIPEAMEDHWFMYCDGSHIRYYRSWTGLFVFDATYTKADDGNGFEIVKLRIHPDTDHTHEYVRQQTALFKALLMDECGGDSEPYWNEYLSNPDPL